VTFLTYTFTNYCFFQTEISVVKTVKNLTGMMV